MVWNPFRLLKTLAHFEVAGPLSKGLGALSTLVEGDRGQPFPANSEILPMDRLEPSPLALELRLLGNAELTQPLADHLSPLGYSVSTAALAPGQSLVNTPLVVLTPGAENVIQTLIQQLGHLPTYQEAVLSDFRQPHRAIAALWGSLDDGVMGGVSASQVQWHEQGLWFGGQVSTANNGGFASIRTRNIDPPVNLGQWQGTVLYAQGDGQRYKWILRDNPGWDSLAYCRSFDTDAKSSVTVRTLFQEMVATRRARTVPDATPLNPAQIYSMQLMLSKFEYDGALNPAFQAGAFRLTVQQVGVFRQGPKPLVVLHEGTAELGPELAAAGLTGVIPQGNSFKVIGTSDQLPPPVSPAVVETILQSLASDS
jgi:hypothetical protein